MTTTATNPQTGETVVLVGGAWKPAEQTATNAKGEKAYLVGGAWIVPGASTASPETTAGGVLAEVGKGLLRGAGGVGQMIGEAVTVPLGPLGTLARKGVQALTAPSMGIVQPTPETDVEKFAGTASEIVGAGAAGGASGTVRGAVGNVIAGLGGATGEQVGGEVGQVVGTLAPGAVSAAAGAAKNALAKRATENLQTFRQAGTTPSVGQATGNTFVQGLENLASKFPGGAGIMRRFTEAQQRSMGARARTGVSGEDAGRAIEKGIKGESGFLARSKATWQRLDDDLAAKIPKTQAVPAEKTLEVLDDLSKPVKQIGRPHGMSSLLEDTKAFLTGGKVGHQGQEAGPVTYQGLRELRSRVGELREDALVSGISTGEAKRLYGALSEDLEKAALQAGAGKEFARQNQFYHARMKRVEDVLERVIGQGKQPEDIFKSFMPTDPDQANKVRVVMRSLAPEERKMVSEAVVNRLGRATPGRQNEMGEVFSSESFLTNWNKLSTGAKAQLFPNHSMRQNVEAIAKAAASIREGSKVFQNASGTAGSFAAYSVYASPIAAVATGSFTPVVAAGGAAGTAYIGAKMLTSPKVVEWLARPVNPSKPAEAVGHLARLSVIYNQTSDRELKQELERFIASVGQQQ